MKKVLSLIAAGLLVALSSLSALAGTASGSFSVQVNLTSSCSVNTTTGGVGGVALLPTFAYISGQVAAATATGVQFQVTCTGGLPITSFTLDGSTGAVTGTGYSYTAPNFKDTTTGLLYTLTTPAASPGTGVAQTYSLTGTMAAGQMGTCGLASCPSTETGHTLTINF